MQRLLDKGMGIRLLIAIDLVYDRAHTRRMKFAAQINLGHNGLCGLKARIFFKRTGLMVPYRIIGFDNVDSILTQRSIPCFFSLGKFLKPCEEKSKIKRCCVAGLKKSNRR